MTSVSQSALSPKPTILVVDDTPDNLLLLTEVLRHDYRIKVATDGETALELVRGVPPALVLLDIMMPGMDGYEVCRQIKADPRTAHIPVIFLTAKAEIDDECRGLDLGAADYLTKPIVPRIVKARVRTQLALKASADFLRDQNAFLEQEVRSRTREVGVVQDVTIQVLASLAETRDADTGNHIRRTQHYVRVLADHLRRSPPFSDTLDAHTVHLLFMSAPLHDIGKVGIPDRILLKPGRLTPDEFVVMRRHAALGRAAIERAERALGMSVDFLRLAKEIAYSHHEKWDGSGYPDGLAGEAIPLSARLMAVADVYDALISRRVYKEPLPHDVAVAEILACRGTHFDPALVDAFVETQTALRQVADDFTDSEHELAQKRRYFEESLPAQE